MTTLTLSLGSLVLVARQSGPLLTVDVSSPTGLAGTLVMSVADWTTLTNVVDLLALADKEMGKLRGEVERLTGALQFERELYEVEHDRADENHAEAERWKEAALEYGAKLQGAEGAESAMRVELESLRSRLERAREFFTEEVNSTDSIRREMSMLVRNVIEGVING